MNTAKTFSRAKENHNTQTGIDTITIGAITLMGGTSAFVSLWAAACFTVALLNSGPVAMTKSWFMAVAGL